MLQPPNADGLIAELAGRGITLPSGPVSVTGFGDSAQLSRELIALIGAGRKCASSALLWSYEYDAEALPRAGNLAIVVDHGNRPACVTRLTGVTVMPFDQVGAEHAAMEGEGDLSLAWWRTEHQRFFCAECARIGRRLTQNMPVVCTTFELVFNLR